MIYKTADATRDLYKAAGFPPEQAKRPRVSGLKVPRVATPRLGTGTPEGKIPSNPFRGNWVTMKRPATQEKMGDSRGP